MFCLKRLTKRLFITLLSTFALINMYFLTKGVDKVSADPDYRYRITFGCYIPGCMSSPNYTAQCGHSGTECDSFACRCFC